MRLVAVAAALVAGLVMAGAASAQVWNDGGDDMPVHQSGTPIYSGMSMPGSAPVSLPVVQRACKPGWTEVTVGIAPGGTVRKCAAVGDLRDPE